MDEITSIGFDPKGKFKNFCCGDNDCIHYDKNYQTNCSHEWVEIHLGRCIFKTIKEPA